MSNIQDLINTLELSYTNNHLLVSIEKKYIKLVNIEIIPHIEVILCQYYLVILGGDYQSSGLVIELKNYINKMKINLEQIKKINYSLLNEEQNTKIKNLNEIISKNYSKSLELYKKMYELYQKEIENSINNDECKKFKLNNLHKLQLQTNYNYFNNINDENHNYKLNEALDFLNKLLEMKEYEDIYIKFIDSQISVIEQQFELLKI